MKPTSPLGVHIQSLATAGLLAWASQAQAANPYQEETHGPRVGTRILHFFRDLAYGENPNDRYRHMPRNRAPQQYPQQYQQQRPQAYVPPPPGGNRYNLDRPPTAAAYPRSQPQGHPAPRQAPQPHPQQSTPYPVPAPAPTPQAQPDMPYPSPASEPPSSVERDDSQAGIGSQREDLPPVTIKPKSGGPTKTASAPSKPAPNVGPLPPPLPSVKSETPSTAASNQLASNTASASKKSWQTNQTTESTFAPPPSVSAPAQSPAPTSSAPTTPSSNNTTLTGSRTSKDGRVKSPYPPYNELDVSGLPTGSLAMDPTTGKVFRVP